ncbi:hypothetical protein UPYG_G00219430 [Umbra pygmaea]|uniref:Tudor domain-containing protein n=1 Tax=Umbra pygmaea TaxID=75934 RepID=A0ABD0X7J6_UMBPY
MPRQMSPDLHTDLNVNKRRLMYKLLLLENAWTTLEKELTDFTQQVHGFLSQPHSNDLLDYDNLIRALDTKRYALEKLSALFKNLTADQRCCFPEPTRQLVSLSQSGLCRPRGFQTWSEVLRFGPMLHNVFMAGSIAKALRSLRPLRRFSSSSRSPDDVDFQKDGVLMCTSWSSSCHNREAELNPSPSECSADLDQNIDKEEKISTQQSDTVEVQASTITENINNIPNRKMNRCKLAPPKRPVFTLTSSTQNTPLTPPVLDPGRDFITVEHQKQTSSQLMHFLLKNGKNNPEYTDFSEQSGFYQHITFSSTVTALAMSCDPIKETPKYIQEVKNRLETNSIGILKKEWFSELKDNRLKQYGPIFTRKHVESGSFVSYRCVIATTTELWDIGDILTKGTQCVTSSDVNITSSSKMAAADMQGQGGGGSPVDMSTRPLNQQGTSTHSLKNTDVMEKVLEEINKNNHTLQHQRFQSCSFVDHGNQLSVIPEFQVRKFTETAVVVSHLVHPGNFYIQHADADLKLEGLTAMDPDGSSTLAELQCIPDIGAHILAWFPQQQKWCRAEVLKICGMSKDKTIEVEVRRLDYGDTSCLSLCNIKGLTPTMTSLPLQAIQVTLANVRPADGCFWTHVSVSWFRDMVENRILYARVYPQVGSELTSVELFMEKGKMGAMRRGASLSLRLAQNGHAKHSQWRNLDVRQVKPKSEPRDRRLPGTNT